MPAEPTTPDPATQARIDAVTWYHEFDFGNGLRTRSHTAEYTEMHRALWRFIEGRLAGVEFAGRTVLDVGCWDGYWSFYAERRGARSVLASDDRTQNWAASGGLLLARELLGSRVEVDLGRSAYDLTSLGRRFDVVLCLGVHYHLYDPFLALTQLRHCCHDDTVVVIEGEVGTGLPDGAALYDLTPTRRSAFLPTRRALGQLVRAAYLDVQSEALLHEPPPAHDKRARLGWRWRLETCRQVLAGSRAGIKAQTDVILPPPTHSNRILLVCRPFRGANELHVYRPPFGLHAYDDRFAAPARAAA